MSRIRKISAALLLLAISVSLEGCAWMRGWMGPRDPFAQNAPCIISESDPVEVVVAHLNANSTLVAAWQSDHISVRGHGAAATPMSIDARLAIEAPRNFRLTAGTPLGGEEVDFGSNQNEFWFWNRRSEEKCVHVAFHDEQS